MQIEKVLALPTPFTLIWEEGKVTLQDMDIESELIAHILSDTSPPFDYFVVAQFLKELHHCSKRQFIQNVGKFNHILSLDTYQLRQYMHLQTSKEKAMRLYAAEKLGFEIINNFKIGKRIQDWFIALENPTVPQKTFLYSWSRNKNTPPQVLSRIARKHFYFHAPLAANPSTPNEGLRVIIQNEVYSLGDNGDVLLNSLKNWKDVFPSDLAQDLLKHDFVYIDETLAKIQIKEDIQLVLAQSPYRIVRDALKKNKFLSPVAEDYLKGKIPNEEMEL